MKRWAHHLKNVRATLRGRLSRFPRWLVSILKFLSLFIVHPVLRYVTLFFFALFLIGIGYVLQELPSPRRLTSKDNYAVSTLIFDRNGTQLYEIFADENRVPVDLEALPPHVAQATIAIEDKKFYHHFGFDILGIIRAARNNLTSESVEGGSTITQQLVKNALLTNEKSFTRKAKELILSVFTEILYSKDDILEMYLNYISYGGTAVGIEAASKQYFNKSAKDLTLAEASLLAGLPQAPSRYSPFASDATASKNRQAEVLRRMVEEKYITEEEAENAKNEKLTFALDQTDIQAPHFVFYVRDLLYEKYGVETVEKGGLRVHTTLDLSIQQAAQASVAAEVKKLANYRVSNGAALVLKPNTGEILAMVGSKDYFDDEVDGKVNVTLRLRQPGSSIKPLMYATAFQEKELNPGTVLLDVPTCFKIAGQPDYCPKNYDGSFKGPVTIRRSLGNSLNIPAVKGLKIVGVVDFIDQAKKMGITTWKDPSNYGLSLTLGGGEVRMIDLAQAFGVLANQGVEVPLTPILKVEDYTGEVLEEIDVEERKRALAELNEFEDDREGDLRRVMDQAPAYLTSHILQDNGARTEAFGPKSQLVIPGKVVSVKTGTTNDLKDNWTIGYTPEYLVATWVGNNDSTPMNPYLVSGITGAAPIWNDIMTYVLTGKESIWPDKPGDVAGGKVCASGMPPKYSKDDCKPLVEELYWTKSKPSRSTMFTKEVWIKADTGLPPAIGEQADNLQLQSKTVYQDPITEQYCGDCARPTNEQGEVQYEKQIIEEYQKKESKEN
jgi:1A family penicillin-binding protein